MPQPYRDDEDKARLKEAGQAFMDEVARRLYRAGYLDRPPPGARSVADQEGEPLPFEVTAICHGSARAYGVPETWWLLARRDYAEEDLDAAARWCREVVAFLEEQADLDFRRLEVNERDDPDHKWLPNVFFVARLQVEE